MQVRFDGPVFKLDGTAAQQPNGIEGGTKDLTLIDAVVEALLATVPDDKAAGADKMIRFTIAQKIHNADGGPVELTAEELTAIKKAVMVAWSPLVVGRVYERIEGFK